MNCLPPKHIRLACPRKHGYTNCQQSILSPVMSSENKVNTEPFYLRY